MESHRNRSGLAGVIGAGVSLGVGEFLAGVIDAVPSPLAAVGGAVVDRAPQWLSDLAIGLLGTADKGALAIGTVFIALAAGLGAGLASIERPWVLPSVFSGFGVLGVVAGAGEPLADLAPVVGATAVAAGTGLGVALWLGGLASAEDPADRTTANRDRRRFVGGAVAGAVGAIALGVWGRRLLTSFPEVRGIGFGVVEAADAVGAEHSFDEAGLTPIVVPNRDFYRIDTALVVPRISVEEWTLQVRGRVGRELNLSYDDLLGMDLVERHVTLACVSNEVGGDLVGNALWTGVRLREVLDLADADLGAGGQVVGRSVDRWTAGFPTAAVTDGRDALIAVGMNGDPLPAVHGFPARLVVPGLYGYVSATKWLSALEVVGWDEHDGYWIPRGWAKRAPIKTQSRIDLPRSGETRSPGPIVVAGVAWAPGPGVGGVQLNVDGREWGNASITTPLSSQAWVQWRTEVDLPAGSHSLAVRAIDGTGAVQTPLLAPPRPDGATGHHTVSVRVG